MQGRDERVRASVDESMRALRALGWRVAVWPSPGRSMAIPILRCVYLRHGWTGATVADAAVLAHEATHAARAEVAGAWWWTLRYLLDPWFRGREEVAGEAAGVACEVDLTGRRGDLPMLAARSHQLGRWRWPYLVPGCPEEWSARIETAARRLLGLRS